MASFTEGVETSGEASGLDLWGSTPTSTGAEPTAEESGYDWHAAPTPRGQSAGPHLAESTSPSESQTIFKGECLARISVRTLFVKDWKPCYWVIRKDRLWLFRNQADYEHSPAGTGMKKEVPIRENLTIGDIKYKSYSGFGGLHHFTVDEVVDGSTSTVVKFASTKREEIIEVHSALVQRLQDEKMRRLDYAVRAVGTSQARQVVVDEEVMRETTRKAAT
jgi:hypothetical protein